MKSRQNDKKLTFQVRLDIYWRKTLTVLRAEQERSIKALVEEALGEYYSPANSGKGHLLKSPGI